MIRVIGVVMFVAAGASASDVEPVSEVSYHTQEVRGGFIERSVGPRTVAMGEAGAAGAEGPAALHVNPGSLEMPDRFCAVAMYGAMGNGMSINSGGVAIPIGNTPFPRSVIALGVVAMNYGAYGMRDENGVEIGTATPTDFQFALGWAFENPGWLILRGRTGIAVEVVTEDAASGALPGFSWGSVFRLGARWRLGAAVQHLGPKADGYALPAAGRIGGSFVRGSLLRWTMDITYPFIDRQIWAGTGGELSPDPAVAFRVGYKYVNETGGVDGLQGITAGLGFTFGPVGVDYAYQPFGDLAMTHRIAVSYGRPARTEDDF